MKWRNKKSNPSFGDIREREKFAWLPTKMTSEDITVWLECYMVREVFVEGPFHHEDKWWEEQYRWSIQEWGCGWW